MISIFTEVDIMPRYKDLPLEEIRIEHVQAYNVIARLADTVVVHKQGRFKVIKDRHEEPDGLVREAAVLYRFVEDHNHRAIEKD